MGNKHGFFGCGLRMTARVCSRGKRITREGKPMREPPDISAEALTASVQSGYGISVISLIFLPIGHDSSAWVY